MNVVVIGHGMVGSRFVLDLLESDPGAFVTVLGREDAGPYNRVLLSNVVAGTSEVSMLAMSAASGERVRVLDGVSAIDVDRQRRLVTDSNGESHPYDRLVLATGSQARIPAVLGIATDRGLLPGVSVLKDLADAEGIVARIPRARRAVVLGAGVLGLEVATGLAFRGLAVTVVHHSDRLMERQLGDAAATIATGSLHRLGVSVMTQTSVVEAVPRRGVLHSLRLTDGTHMLADLLVMCAGTIPETTLARRCQLPCERGVVVTEDLVSPADPAVFAIGDCAQPPAGGSGLVAQGWDQARRLVETWRGGEDPAAAGGSSEVTDVVRVKAQGLDIVTMGLSGKFDHAGRDLRAVRIADPSGGRFLEVVVSEGLLVGATVVGDKARAADLSAIYTRMLPVPSDPVHLMVTPLAATAPAASGGVESMSQDSLVCQCNSVTKGRIVEAIDDGATSVEEISRATRASTGCGDCRPIVGELLRSCIAGRTPALAGGREGQS